MKNEQTYLVYYSIGSYEDYKEIQVFTTFDKKKATKWVSKFNRILKQWKENVSVYADKDTYMKWIKPQFVDDHFDRWNRIIETNTATYEIIEHR